jgi:hypothetical protein
LLQRRGRDSISGLAYRIEVIRAFFDTISDDADLVVTADDFDAEGLR